MEVRRCLVYFARLKGIREFGREVDRVITRLDLAGVLGRPCGNLSRGYRQRVGLAQALLGDPSILILDEPTSGLDPNQIHDFRSMIRSLGRDRAVLISTHILSEALEMCDRVLILNRGRMVASGSPDSLTAQDGRLHWARLRLPAAPDPALASRFGLELEVSEGPSGQGLYRVRRNLPGEETQLLLRLAVEQEWEVLEWGSGTAGLEALFRRLTLGEEEA
jgi:ABC-2 type transport system ATP-binding protein